MKTTSLLTLAAIAFSGVAFTNPASATIDTKSHMLGSTTNSAVSANDLQKYELARRGRGADDAPGDDRSGRGRGKDDAKTASEGTINGLYQLAKNGSDDSGSNSSSGRGSDDRGGDDSRGHGRGSDDNGGSSKSKSKSRSSDDNGGGRRPRVPGGSGCDSAHDRAEHAECRG